MSEGCTQATILNLKLSYFRPQNFNVLFADFEQLHVVGIASKVVRDRENLEFWVAEVINHLNINDKVLSTQVIRTISWEDT